MDATTLFENAITHWRDAKGIGTALIAPPLNDKAMVLGVLQRVYAKNPSITSLICVEDFTERASMIDYLTHQEDEENNAEFKRLIDDKFIKIFTFSFVTSDNFKIRTDLTIIYRCFAVNDNLLNVAKKSKFRLVVLNKFNLSSDSLSKLYSISPLLSDFKQQELDSIRISTPVKEMQIGITIPADSEAGKLIKYYDDYIATSLNIFGNLDTMAVARTGDPSTGRSSTQVCFDIAYKNGWNEHLDMSVDLNGMIDSVYNPASIKDRAMLTYDIIRNRSKHLSDYEGKLEEILKIVKEHETERILIINNRGEFAAKVTKYLNDMSETDICGNYHDNVEPVPATDIEGNPLYVKSGAKKGERRMIAAKAQRTLNEAKFNNGLLHVLSTNSAPDKSLSVPIDVVIITSPLCEEIESYLYRLSHITYPNNEIILYSLYIKGSIEEKRLHDNTLSETHTLLLDPYQKIKSDDNFDFVVVD